MTVFVVVALSFVSVFVVVALFVSVFVFVVAVVDGVDCCCCVVVFVVVVFVCIAFSRLALLTRIAMQFSVNARQFRAETTK